MKNLPIQLKAMLAPIIIIALLAIIVVVLFTRLSSVNHNILVITDDLAPDTATSSSIMREMYRKRLAVKNFLQTSNDASLASFATAENELNSLIELAFEKIQNPDRVALLNEISDLDQQYNQAFYNQVVANMNKRHELVNGVLNVEGPKIEQVLTQVMKSADRDNDAAAAVKAGETLRHLLLARLYVFRFLTDNDQASYDAVLAELDLSMLETQKLLAELQNPQRRQLTQQAQTSIGIYEEGFEQVAQAIFDRNDAVEGILDMNGPVIAQDTVKLTNSVFESMDTQADSAKDSIVLAETYLLLLSIVAGVVGLLVSFIVARGIVQPIIQAQSGLHEIAQGDGDLTKRLVVTGRDEVGRLAESFNQFITKLEGIISNVRQETGEVIHSAQSVNSTAETTAAAIVQQGDEITQVASAINELEATAVDVASNAANAANAAHEGDVQSKMGSKVISTISTDISQLAEDMQKSADEIGKLKSETVEIGSVLDVIKNIAEQTNLLALNAAIEAARAGEQGRGFAVVADEVRSLAQKTQESTQVIEQSITGLQSQADSSVKMIEGNRASMNSLVEDAKGATEALAAITASVTAITDVNSMIATAAEEQTGVVSEVNTNVSNIQGLSSANQDRASELNNAASELVSVGERLSALVNQFKVSA